MVQGRSFRSGTAFAQLYYMLDHGDFKQRQMSRDLDIPHGAIINGFVNWLVELKFASKIINRQQKLHVYRIISPVALISFYSHFRNMTTLKISKNWGDDRSKVIEHLKDMGGVFCLTTALEHYTEYVRDPAIHVYVPDDFLNKMQTKETTGTVRVNMYPFKPYSDDNIIEKDGLKITTKLRTIIDLYCDDKAYTTETLIRQLWP